MQCDARDRSGNRATRNIIVGVGRRDDVRPTVVLRYPFSGSVLRPGLNTFACEASDDQGLRSIEIEFNNEHRRRCDSAGDGNGVYIFEDFYIGADLRGRTIPIRCTGFDQAGNGAAHAILVRID